MQEKPLHVSDYITAGSMTGTSVITGDGRDADAWTHHVFLASWTSTPVGTFTVEGSHDDSTYYEIPAIITAHPTGAVGSSRITVPPVAAFVRLKYTNASSSGTLTVKLTRHVTPHMVDIALPTAVVAGQNTDIDAAAEQIVTANTPLRSGVWLKALPGNTDQVYVGAAGVTASTGYPLDADQFTFIEIDNLNKVYAIGGAANQGLAYFGS